jgi:predicted alpha/beta-hydrolase family hydrolase
MHKLTIAVQNGISVSALAQAPADASACLLLAHGAGAGMTHPFMQSVADGLEARGVASLRYQFPSMEAGGKRPDRPPLAHATVRAAVAQAARLFAGLRLFAGGKSFGARMTSQSQALEPLAGVEGLVFLGFPLHPAGIPATSRADHLVQVALAMLFVQGTRDKLADPAFLKPVVDGLGARATLMAIAQADHSFHVPKRSGRDDAQVLAEVLDGVVAWMRAAPTPT